VLVQVYDASTSKSTAIIPGWLGLGDDDMKLELAPSGSMGGNFTMTMRSSAAAAAQVVQGTYKLQYESSSGDWYLYMYKGGDLYGVAYLSASSAVTLYFTFAGDNRYTETFIKR
jgi:hypothetical protein